MYIHVHMYMYMSLLGSYSISCTLLYHINYSMSPPYFRYCNAIKKDMYMYINNKKSIIPFSVDYLVFIYTRTCTCINYTFTLYM